MQIAVVCPHCEARFQLGSELAGKSMRCPTCREVFKVEAAAEPEKAPEPEKPTTAGAVTDFVPFVEVEGTSSPGLPYERVESTSTILPELITDSSPPSAAPAGKPVPAAAPAPAARSVPAAAPKPAPKEVTWTEEPSRSKSAPKEVTWTEDAAPPKAKTGPKEVAWSEDAAPPPPARSAPAAKSAATPAPTTRSRRAAAEDDEEYVRTHKPRRRLSGPVLLLLLFGILGVLGGTGYMLYQYYGFQEQTLALEADEAYKNANYAVAQKKYEDLLTEFPNSQDKDKYQFFARLSETQAAVASVTARENPAPAKKAFEGFVAEFGESPFVHPEAGYGTDVVQTGKRLTDTITDHATDRLTAFRGDRTKMAELDASEQAVGEGEALIPVIDRFRAKDGLPLDDVRQKFAKLTADHKFERHRLKVLEPFRGITNDPHADDVERFQAALKQNNLADDAEALQMIAAAEKRIRELTGFSEGRVQARALPPAPRPIVFAAQVPGSPTPRVTPDMPQDVVFAVARGVLYALDAAGGSLLWGVPIGPTTADPGVADVPLRVSLAGGQSDGVVIAGEWAGQPAITARMSRGGEAVWYQPLPALPVTRPILAGGRVYVPLRDRVGTVVEFDRTTGDKTGEFTIRQPIAGGIAVLPGTQPGLNYLFVPGDTRRVFVFEVGREDTLGRRLDPRCARVLLTEHPRDSLRGEPLLITPIEEEGPRMLVLTQTDGPTTTTLRTFTIPKPEQFAPAEGGPTEEPAQKSSDVSVPGWTWFPSRTNGERVVLATDAGAFLALGVNQTGNLDKPLFPLPAPKPTKDQQDVARSMVVSATEDSYWAVVNNRLLQLRTAIDPIGGLRIIPQGLGRAVGEPLHRAEVRDGSDLGVVVVRPGGSANVQAVAFDVRSGQIRWQTRLGMVPTAAPVVRGSGPSLVADTEGGVFTMDLKETPETAPSIAAKVLAPPIKLADGSTAAQSVASADGRMLWVLTPFTEADGLKLHVRLVADGVLKADRTVALPDQFAGPPVVWGSFVMVPLANGYVYRLDPSQTAMQVGPLWRGDTREAMPKCFLAPIDDAEFLATDGGRRVMRWKWPTGAEATKTGGPWECRSAIALAPAMLPGSATRFAVAEVSGRVSLFDTAQADGLVRRWPGVEKSAIPTGSPTDQLIALSTEGKTLLVYAVGQLHLVAIDPEQPEPVWVAENVLPADVGAWVGWNANGETITVTGLTGRVVVLDVKTGQPLPDAVPTVPNAIAAKPAVNGSKEAGTLLMLQNGTGVVLK